MPDPNSFRLASSSGPSEIVSSKVAIVLYREQNGRREILVENVTLREVNDKNRFKLLQGDEDPSDNRIGYNAYRIMEQKYHFLRESVKLMEINPKVYLSPIESPIVRQEKGFHVTSTRYVLMELTAPRARLEMDGSPFTWFNSVDVSTFTHPFRVQHYRENLRYFDFEVPD